MAVELDDALIRAFLLIFLPSLAAAALICWASRATDPARRLQDWTRALGDREPVGAFSRVRPDDPLQSFADLLAARSGRLPLNFLLVSALMLARARSSGPAALPLCIFAFFAHHAFGGLLPAHAYRDLLRYTALRIHAEQNPTALAPPILRDLLDVEPCFPIFLDLLARYWHENRAREIVDTARTLPNYMHAAQHAVTCGEPPRYAPRVRPAPPFADALHAAELIGWGLIHNSGDPRSADDWVLPLLQRSTETFLLKTVAAHFLCERFFDSASPQAVAKAIETHVHPRAWDDYSNFQAVFSLTSWIALRKLLSNPRVITELELFVTRHDRRRFWLEFHHREVTS